MKFEFTTGDLSTDFRGVPEPGEDGSPIGVLVEPTNPKDRNPTLWQEARDVRGAAMLSKIFVHMRVGNETVSLSFDDKGCELLRSLLALRDAQRIRFESETGASNE